MRKHRCQFCYNLPPCLKTNNPKNAKHLPLITYHALRTTHYACKAVLYA